MDIHVLGDDVSPIAEGQPEKHCEFRSHIS
jgi:hypothetical protein